MESVIYEKYRFLAYHESGKIAIAYLAGFACDKVDISNQWLECDKSILNFSSYSLLVESIFNYNNDSSFYQSLPDDKKKESAFIAHRVASIIIAGSVASSIYKNNYNKVDKSMVKLESMDLKKINEIKYFLEKEKKLNIPNFIDKTVKYTLDLFNADVWISINSLAKTLIRSGYDYKLNRKLIENNLYRSGLFTYKESLRLINSY